MSIVLISFYCPYVCTVVIFEVVRCVSGVITEYSCSILLKCEPRAVCVCVHWPSTQARPDQTRVWDQ